jgi:hypothetical protein
MFGIVPGMKYGWPKNVLHWHGIHESILDTCATIPIHFVIADGSKMQKPALIEGPPGSGCRRPTSSFDHCCRDVPERNL